MGSISNDHVDIDTPKTHYSVTEYVHATSNPDVEDVMMINCHRTHRSRPRHNHQQCGFHL